MREREWAVVRVHELEQMVKDMAARQGNSDEAQGMSPQLSEERRTHEAFRKQANTMILHQQKRLSYLENAILGAEKQMNDAVRQKDAAENKTKELERLVEALTTESTSAWIRDLQELIPFSTVKPDEVRDLTQALTVSQKNHAAAVEENEALRETIKQKEKKFSRLNEKFETAETKAVRTVGALEMAKSHLDTSMSTVPALAKQFGSSEESAEFEKVVDETRVREAAIIEKLQSDQKKISTLEAKVLTLNRNHGREVDRLNTRLDELEKERARLDGQLFLLPGRLEDAQLEIANLRASVREHEEAALCWRRQCEEQAFGDDVEVFRNLYKSEVQRLNDKIGMLQHSLALKQQEFDRADVDLLLSRQWLYDELTGLREAKAERDWYQPKLKHSATAMIRSWPSTL